MNFNNMVQTCNDILTIQNTKNVFFFFIAFGRMFLFVYGKNITTIYCLIRILTHHNVACRQAIRNACQWSSLSHKKANICTSVAQITRRVDGKLRSPSLLTVSQQWLNFPSTKKRPSKQKSETKHKHCMK